MSILERLRRLEFRDAAQKSIAWLKLRVTRITASEAAGFLELTKEIKDFYARAFPNAPPLKGRQCCIWNNPKEAVIKKAQAILGIREQISNQFTEHGNLFEEVAIRYYELTTGRIIHSFGLLCHETEPRLAGSPDGVTECGRLLEAKCPPKRAIHDYASFAYWMQMQQLMEVADLEWTDFIDLDVVKITQQEYESAQDRGRVGIIAMHKDGDAPQYAPLSVYHSQDFDGWFAQQNETGLFSAIYYRVKGFHIVPVRRDREFFAHVFPLLMEALDKAKELVASPELLLAAIREKDKVFWKKYLGTACAFSLKRDFDTYATNEPVDTQSQSRSRFIKQDDDDE